MGWGRKTGTCVTLGCRLYAAGALEAVNLRNSKTCHFLNIILRISKVREPPSSSSKHLQRCSRTFPGAAWSTSVSSWRFETPFSALLATLSTPLRGDFLQNYQLAHRKITFGKLNHIGVCRCERRRCPLEDRLPFQGFFYGGKRVFFPGVGGSGRKPSRITKPSLGPS